MGCLFKFRPPVRIRPPSIIDSIEFESVAPLDEVNLLCNLAAKFPHLTKR